MKKALLKTAFNVSVFIFTIVFLIPAQLLLEVVLPIGHDAQGRFRSIDRLFPGMLVIFACLVVANRIASYLFWSAHLSHERWSVFDSRRSRRSV